MKIIIISTSQNFEHEAQEIVNLFNNGLETFHLRKPDQSEKEFERTLRAIPAQYFKRIVIHNHYKLIEKYNLKGIHLTEHFMKSVTPESLKMIVNTIRKRNLTISASFHSVEALKDIQIKPDYVFLGPVFDSISKAGYTSQINLETVTAFISEAKNSYSIFALGGVNKNNIGKIKSAGFNGAALLGAIWQNGTPGDNFLLINTTINE